MVKFFGTLRLDLGVAEISVVLSEVSPLSEVLRRIAESLGEKGPRFLEKLLTEEDLRPGVIILRNGANILHLEGLKTPIGPGDTLVIFPPGGGG